jgi:acetoin utilization deacetylase AcuC-like enzyme
MKKVGLIYHENYLKHDTDSGHPERKERLIAIVEHLKKSDIKDMINWFSPELRKDVEKWILKVHSPRHFEFVKSSILAGIRLLDFGDTYVSKDSLMLLCLLFLGLLMGLIKFLVRVLTRFFAL